MPFSGKLQHLSHQQSKRREKAQIQMLSSGSGCLEKKNIHFEIPGSMTACLKIPYVYESSPSAQQNADTVNRGRHKTTNGNNIPPK